MLQEGVLRVEQAGPVEVVDRVETEVVEAMTMENTQQLQAV